MGEILVDFDKIRIGVIRGAYVRGMRYGNLDPNSQTAQWLAVGLKRLEEGRDLKEEDLKEIDLMGGTDHPDPWFH